MLGWLRCKRPQLSKLTQLKAEAASREAEVQKEYEELQL
ncbi:hypothetical protein Gotur_005673 [Gossypium turneri]